MGRKRTKINAIRGERLGTLLKEHKIDQKDFAVMMNYSEEHISYIINGKRNLTEDAAKRIVEKFPGTRIGWLLGYEDYKTELDLFMGEVQKIQDNGLVAQKLLEYAVDSLGYRFESTDNKIACLVRDDIRIEFTEQEFEELEDELVRYSIFLIEGLNYKKNKPQYSLLFRKEALGIG